MQVQLPPDWQNVLSDELRRDSFADLIDFLGRERVEHTVFPPEEQVFRAYELSSFDETKVVIVGQDPYHRPGQAHGLCFSVSPGVRPPPSLVNLYKELRSDLGIPMSSSGFLEPWARQGVLLLNSVLTVRAHEPNSHKNKGWEHVTDATLAALGAREQPLVFALFGNEAKKKARLISRERHSVIECAHPSPLSARHWFGSRPFSRINIELERQGSSPIDWRVPDSG